MGIVLVLPHSVELYLLKAEFVTTISWLSVGFSLLFPFPNSVPAWCEFISGKSFLRIIDPYPTHPLSCEKEAQEALKIQPKYSYVDVSVFWNALAFCPAKRHFL